ncbi:hypothetical protein PSD17_45710 [Pseudonocardia sp. D17]|nr:hypothetical protein PSD17_45710 [Pseudonocardia sp. D17]
MSAALDQSTGVRYAADPISSASAAKAARCVCLARSPRIASTMRMTARISSATPMNVVKTASYMAFVAVEMIESSGLSSAPPEAIR